MENLGTTIGRLLANFAGAIVFVVIAWQGVRVILKGGEDRAVREALLRILMVVIIAAALANLDATARIATNVGNTAWTEITRVVDEAI